MKRFLCLLVLLPLFAADFDGTKGTITIATTGDAHHTVVAVSSSAPLGPGAFQVSLVYKPAGSALNKTDVRFVSRPFNPKLPLAPVLAVFDVAVTDVTSVSVGLQRQEESQIFTPRN